MKSKPVFILSFLLLFLPFLACAWFLQSSGMEPLDMVMANGIVQSASLQWAGLVSGEEFVYPDDWKDMDFTIFSNNGTALWASRPGLPETIHEAAAHKDTLLDISREQKTVGKAAVYNSQAEQLLENRTRIVCLILFVCTLEFLLLFFYFLYLRRNVFRPFHKLRVFAARVAGGDLDFPLKMDQKNIFGAFTESFDLMREELKKSRAQEQAANQSKKELVAKLSHDIKTPVASILAVSELMAVTADTEKEKRQLSVIREKALQIDHLISDLFHASLEELQELTVTPSAYGSSELDGMLKNADYQGKAKWGRIPECMLVFDKMRLQQVFDNIFSNSYKYADSAVKVSFAWDQEYLSISIKDFGPGVLEQERPLLFEKFFQGKNAEGKSGAGLGLFISRYLLEKMGGNISCENTEDGFCVKVFVALQSTEHGR